MASYPSKNLDDPEAYIAEVVTLLCGYPTWVGASAIDAVRKASPRFMPGYGEISNELETQVRVTRYAAEWEQGAQQLVKDRALLTGPKQPRPTLEELKAKYGPNWGISSSDNRKPRDTPEEARAKLIAQVGQEAFDAIPNADEYAMQRLKYPGRRYGEEPVP